MPSIQDTVEIWRRLESDRLHVLMHRCVRVRNRHTACQACVDVCPTGCISIEDNRIEVDPFACVGCGTCATACPTDALVPLKPTDLQLEEACTRSLDENGGTVVIGCRDIMDRAAGRYDPNRAVRVECLGRVDESLLTGLCALGAERIVLACGDCDACDLSRGGQMALEVALTMRDLLPLWHCDAPIEVANKLPGFVRNRDEVPDGSRRDMMTSAKDTAVNVAAATADVELGAYLGQEESQGFSLSLLRSVDGRHLPQFTSQRRTVLRDALGYLGEPEDDILTSRLWGHAELDAAACDGCGMCEMFCPSGALRMVYAEEENDTSGHFKPFTNRRRAQAVAVDVFPAQCLQCMTCQNVCPKGAISIDPQVFATDIVSGVGERLPIGDAAPSASES